ncbi:MAG TPA: hypothetical protein VIT19_10830 [Pyrinomonadaceae bacterium]
MKITTQNQFAVNHSMAFLLPVSHRASPSILEEASNDETLTFSVL